MKVFLGGRAAASAGGMFRVYDGLYKYLPEYGVELVDEIDQAEIVNPHIAIYHTFPSNIPLVLSSHGLLWAEEKWGMHSAQVNRMCIQSMLAADVVTVPSDFVRKAVLRNTLIDPVVVRHGIDTDAWKPSEEVEGYVFWNKARIDPANRTDAFDQMATLLPEQPFVGTFGKKVNNTRIIGNVKPEDMHSWVSRASVYLSTSIESGGPCFGVLEAMSCGVPVLAWNQGGTAEAIEHKVTGYLVEPDNYEDMVDGLLFCLKNREELGTNARQKCIETYQWNKTVGGYVKAYQQAIDLFHTPVKTSVIITAYNLEDHLPNAIKSIQNQTVDNWEVVVVDDGSTDRSGEIADHFAEQDSRIKVVHQENMHVSDARNTGVKHARGRYIIPLDADDQLFPDALETLEAVLDNDRNAHTASGKIGIMAADGYRVSAWPAAVDPEQQILGHNQIPYSSLIRRTVWERVGGERRRIRDGTEDADLWARIFSFGYRPVLVDKPTLLYQVRSDSLSRQHASNNKWLAWFPWSEDRELAPAPLNGYHVRHNLKPDVSVIIPVGPGHEHFIQSALDSVLAQTMSSWESVIVNDTGKPLDPFWLGGHKYATVVDSGGKGVAHARNVGAQAAKAERIVFLDADDLLLPEALSLLVMALDRFGGWIYSDWYAVHEPDTEPELVKAKDWSVYEIKQKAISAITGIYSKKDVLATPFDPTLPGWEDWDFHLSLLEKCVCGARLEYPTFVYNMHYGQRREDNFSKRKDLVKYIVDKHKGLYEGNNMGCKSCGQRGTVSVTRSTVPSKSTAANTAVPYEIEYIGPEIQMNRVNSKVARGRYYRFSANRNKFLVAPEDVSLFNNKPAKFRVLGPVKTPEIKEKPDVLISDMPIPKREKPVSDGFDSLGIDDERVVNLLRDNFSNIGELFASTDAQLLSIKGIGPSRLTEIRKVISEWHGS